MYIICQESEIAAAIDAIAKTVSLLNLKQEKNRINRRIQSLLHIADDMMPGSSEYQWVIAKILELMGIRDYIRWAKKTINSKIQALLHALWVNRVANVSRTLANLSLDLMNIALPVPPTFEATLSSFGRGRNLDVFPC